VTSIVGQVTRATLLVAAFAVVTLALSAALVSRFVFESQEEGIIRHSATALAEAVRHELVEEKLPIEAVAQDSIKESGLVDNAVEIWSGESKAATNRPGETIGRGPLGVVVKSPGWIAVTVPVIPEVTLVVAAPRDRGARASRIVAWSLAFAAPLAMLIALLMGRSVARRVTGPLIAFRDRFARAGPLSPLERAADTDPREVREVDAAFRAQWQRVKEGVDREHEFAANAAHELRTPLTRLRLLADRIRENPGEAGGLAAQQVAELERTSKLVDALLVLSRAPEAHSAAQDAVNLSDLVRASVASVFGAEETPPPGLPDEAMVRGDEDLLRTAVLNLIDNARKFGSAGTICGVDLRVEAARVKVKVSTPGGHIDGAARALLFERFYRCPEARAEKAGHGLGLSLARHIALMHGGDVTLVSAEDEDAAFLLDLPAWQAK